MADLAVFAQIQTVSNGALTIQDANDPTVPYNLVRNGVGPGSSSMRKMTVESPFISGRHIVHQVAGVTSVTLQIRIRAATFDWLDYYTAKLLAFYEDAFHLAIVIDGTSHNWIYEAPDNWTVGDPSSSNIGNWDSVSLRSYTQVVTAQGVRRPTTAGGRF